MRLQDAVPAGVAVPQEVRGVEIRGITASSASAGPGMIFAALPGARTDGALFIPDAVARGAAVILAGADKPVMDAGNAVLLQVANPRRVLAQIAARLHPGQPATAVAVTGTSGKTSVADFTRQIFAALGHRAASLGTIGLIKPNEAIYGSLTTPDPVTLHATLDALSHEGITHLAFEASSHGLDQHRLDGVKLTAAAFTNLGRDHMDYHATVEDYLAAKLRLFNELLEPGQTAVINADGAFADRVVAAARTRGLRVITTGAKGETLRRLTLRNDGFAQAMVVEAFGRRHNVRLPLVGAYQAENALTAAGLAIAAGEDPAAVLSCLDRLRGVPGRLEIVGEANGGLAIVDYAHKPEALSAALDACRPFATGRLISVFGCGGDRDKGKRPIMGRISVGKADITIVTDDNPRTETPADIRAEILAGATGAIEIEDRAQAIAGAVKMMGKGDVVLVAGKGHETGQIVGTKVVPFSDHEVLRAALDEVRADGG
ncbi:MAG TPA: UDP-N-acetylmuramoyl-L-alanyl-D-glutamate--2,6-diaminopimelate ligase [Hyphomicrobium sp.]|nr:UDP-N-acetylmuramoyl-L-alanyl-D-glutamate--2,6-diaminopimelate ligase [Hyphomicrobium sp.]